MYDYMSQLRHFLNSYQTGIVQSIFKFYITSQTYFTLKNYTCKYIHFFTHCFKFFVEDITKSLRYWVTGEIFLGLCLPDIRWNQAKHKFYKCCLKFKICRIKVYMPINGKRKKNFLPGKIPKTQTFLELLFFPILSGDLYTIANF